MFSQNAFEHPVLREELPFRPSYTSPSANSWARGSRRSHKFTGSLDLRSAIRMKAFLKAVLYLCSCPHLRGERTLRTLWCLKKSMLPSRTSWYETAHFRSFVCSSSRHFTLAWCIFTLHDTFAFDTDSPLDPYEFGYHESESF